MHIVMLALGSRGDVQPFVALAVVLQERGHRVTVAAAADYGPLAAAYGVPFAPVGGYVSELMNMGLVNELLDGAHNPLYFARAFLGELAPLLTTILADCWQIAQQADLLIVSTLASTWGWIWSRNGHAHWWRSIFIPCSLCRIVPTSISPAHQLGCLWRRPIIR